MSQPQVNPRDNAPQTAGRVPVALGATAQPSSRRKAKPKAGHKGGHGHHGKGGKGGNGGAGAPGKGGYGKRPVTPGSMVTNHQANQQANAAVGQQYGPVTQQLDQAGQNIQAWFPAYQNELKALGNEQQMRYALATQQMQRQADQQAFTQAGYNTGLQKDMQADAAKRGQQYSGAPSAQGQAAQNIGQQLAQGFQQALSTQGGAYSGFTQGQRAVGDAAQLQARQELSGKKQELAREKGAAKTNYISGLRQDEQKNVLEQQAFGLDLQKEQDTVTQKTKDRRARARQNRQDNATSRANTQSNNATSVQNTNTRTQAQQQAAAERKQEQKQAAKQKVLAKKKEASHTEHVRLVDIGARWDLYKRTPYTPNGKDKNGNPFPSRKPTDDEVRQRLISEDFTAAEIHIAMKLKHNQHLTPSEVQAARELGWRVPQKYRMVGTPGTSGQRYNTSPT